jgi:hypothetical protein
MAAVTIDAGARNAYYSAGNIGWSARSLFAYRTAIQQLASNITQALGASAGNTAVAQSFTPASTLDVNEIRLALVKNSAPTDNVSLQIWSDTGANLPNAAIATADNVYAGGAISLTTSWLTFQFSTPVSLSASTKYWLVVQRSGALDGTNFYTLSVNSGSVYAGGGRSLYNGSAWGAESATQDLCFQILTETPSALYAVTQSTEPALHVWKSTDSGASWSEQDASNNPSVTNATYPFDACDTRSGPYIGTARFTATNTLLQRLFDMSTDTWGADSSTVTASAVNERSIRISIDNTFFTAAPGQQTIHYTTTADDADIHMARRTTAGWTSDTAITVITSTEASLLADVVVDKASVGFQHRIFYDCGGDLFRMRSLTASTQGTVTSIDATAADVETEHASSTFQIYQASNVDKIIAAYIDADGSIQERTATLEVTSASVTLGTEHAVGTATTTAGRQLSTCVYDGDGYVVVSVSGTGITYYIDAGLAGSWDSGTAWKTGLTDTPISQALSIPGVGLAVVYTENGDAKIDFIAVAAGGGATGTATVGTAAAAGGTHTGTGIAHQTGTATVGTASAAGGSHTGTAGAGATGTATVGTASAAGGSHTASAATTGTATVGTAPAAGGTHTGLGVANETGTHTASDAAAAGGSHTATAIVNQTGTHTASDAAAAGGSHTGSAATIGAATVGTASADGGSHTGNAGTVVNETGNATVGTASAAGGSHSANVANTGTATVGTSAAAGGDHAASAGIGTTGTTTTGTASATGGAHIGAADTAGAHTSSDAAATGHTATGTAGTEATGTATAGTAAAAGGSHTGSFVANQTGTATVGTATAEGFEHTGVSAAADDGIHVRGQATAAGGTHTGVVTADATSTTGTASAQGGAHSAGYTATGQHTVGDATAAGGSHSASAGTTGNLSVGTATASGGTHTGSYGVAVDETGTATTGTATATGGSHVGSAGTTGTAVSGLADAAGASHTATAGTTGAHVVGTAVATGHDATGTIAYTGAVTVGEATATGGDHTGSADTMGLLVVGTATAEGGDHFATDGAILGDLHFRLMASKPVAFRTTVQRTLTFRQTQARVLELAAIGEYDG